MIKNIFLLITSFIIALGLRLYLLDQTPNAATWDEAALGYNSYSLLKTGADEYGTKLPIILRSFDDYKPAAYAYLSLIPYKIFGPSLFSIRFISALAGASMVFSIFALTKNFFSTKVALIASVLTIFEPLFLSYSRMALEANLSLAFFVGGLSLWYNKLPYRSLRFLGLLLLTLSAYTYHSPRYLIPIIVGFSYLPPFTLKKIYRDVPLLILFILSYLPILYFVLSPQLNTRFKEISIFTNYGILFGSIANLKDLPLWFSSLSKIYFYLGDFLGRYLGYFNPYQLFIKASGHPLYVVPGMGIFNSFEFIFWISGLIYCWLNFRKFNLLWLLVFIGILPAAVTVDWFTPLRGLFIWPIFLIFIAKGVEIVFKNFSSSLSGKLILFSVFCLWSLNIIRIIDTVFIYRPYVDAGAFQYGFAQMAPFVSEKIGEYDQIIVESPHAQPHIFMAFFTNYPPEQYQNETVWRKTDFSPRHNFDFGPYTFRRIYWPDDRHLKRTLFVGSQFSLPNDQLKQTTNIQFIKDFFTPDGNISFRVVGLN